MQPQKTKRNSADVTLRLLAADDIPALSALAHRIWRTHYANIVSSAQIEYMLAELFSEAALTEQLNNGRISYTLAEYKGVLAGFIAYSEKEPRHVFIDKFYAEASLQGCGIGNALLHHVIAALLKDSEIRLKINRYNIRSINYYFRQGFEIESMVDTPFGPFILNDYVMLKRV